MIRRTSRAILTCLDIPYLYLVLEYVHDCRLLPGTGTLYRYCMDTVCYNYSRPSWGVALLALHATALHRHAVGTLLAVSLLGCQ